MDNLRGAALMVAAMACFATEDMFVKWLSGDLSVGLILLVLGVGGGGVFAIIAKAQGRALLGRDLWHRAVIIRNLGEMMGTFGFVTAIALTPLSSASAILQANPLAVTLGAALFLGADVGWRRWTAIGVGFVGVLLIIQPGMDGFEPASLFAVLGVIGLAIRDLATRAAPKHVTSMQIATWGFAAVAPVGVLLIVRDGGAALPQSSHLPLFIGALAFGIAGYYMIVAAMRVGEVAIVTPFRYTRLIFSLVIGIVAFGERPDAMMLTGAAIIVASGLYTLGREAQARRRARRKAAQSAA